MNFNIFNSIILAGVIQGFVFAFIWLFSKKYKGRSTSFLVALIITYSISNLQYYLLDVGFVSNYQFYNYIYIPWPFLMSPLVLFYGLSIMNENSKLMIKQKLLFLPFIISLLIGLFYKSQLILFEKNTDSKIFDALPSVSEKLAILYSLVVIGYLLVKINRYKKGLSFSKHSVTPRLNWFKNVLIAIFFATLLWIHSEFVIGYGTENYYFYPLWITVAIIIYWLGHIGIYKYGIVKERKQIRKYSSERYSIAEVHKGKSESLEAFENYIINEKNYLDPQITLEKVASELNISAGHLSKIINTDLGVSFKDYLNNLRVTEAKTYLQNPDFSNYTLVAIGLEAGFNSKSAFNASFKKITGLTPSQFKSQTSN